MKPLSRYVHKMTISENGARENVVNNELWIMDYTHIRCVFQGCPRYETARYLHRCGMYLSRFDIVTENRKLRQTDLGLNMSYSLVTN